MKSTVEQLSPTRVRINVEVPFDELKPNFDRAYQKLASQVRIPGFRPGKAPARVLESRLGRGVVLDEVVNEAIPEKYMEFISGGEIRTLGRPDIEVTKIADGDSLGFSVEVDVRPEFTLPAFDELAVTVDDVEVTEEQISHELDELRGRFGTLKGVERPVADGDFVVIDLAATAGGEEIPDASTSGLSYQVGSGQLVEGIDDALIGLSAGETGTFSTSLLAGDHAGQDAEVSVTVQSVKERELPEADDEFAQLASEFDTLDELRDDLRKRLEQMNKMQQAVSARDKVLDALLEATDVPLPEKVVEAEIETRVHDALHPFDHDEKRFEEFLTRQGQTREQFDTETAEEARKAVKTQLVLDSIADANDVTVDQNELTERIVYQAQRYGVSPDEYLKQAQQAGQLGVIYSDVRRGKALAGVLRKAKVTNESGEEVDLSEVFGPEPSAEAAPEASAEASEEPSAEAGAESGQTAAETDTAKTGE
ncbi:MAG TPA: trigger factor [Pseudonocardiaceae bacterium]